MAEEKTGTEDGEDLDADGLVVQQYIAKVLIVLPPSDYAEQTLRHARSSLYNVHVGTTSVSTETDELIQGRLQDEFLVDGSIQDAKMEDYAGVIFVGGEGALALADDPDALRLAREAAEAGKLIGAWDHSVAILAAAGVVKGKRVTGSQDVKARVLAAKGRFTGRQLERDGTIVTAADEAVGIRFGKALAEVVGI